MNTVNSAKVLSLRRGGNEVSGVEVIFTILVVEFELRGALGLEFSFLGVKPSF